MEYIALQLFNGLVNGSFYALLSLGLAVIFGVLRVVNFAHGALYMLGAFAAYLLLQDFGVGFWIALIVAPIGIGIAGMVLERLLIRRLYGLDPLYNFLLTFGLTLMIQDGVRLRYGLQGQPYPAPAELAGSVSAGLVSYPTYRLFVIASSIAGAVVAGFLVGVLASLAAVFNPALENVVAFALMAVVLLVRPAGLFGSLEAGS